MKSKLRFSGKRTSEGRGGSYQRAVFWAVGGGWAGVRVGEAVAATNTFIEPLRSLRKWHIGYQYGVRRH